MCVCVLLLTIISQISAVEYCNMTSCSEHFFNYTYDESVDLLSCECFPGYTGRCCDDRTDCAYGTFNSGTGKCDCFDPHYSGDRCDIIACENDGKFISEDRRVSKFATGCSCDTGISGDFCEKVDILLQGAARVRITTTSRTSSSSSSYSSNSGFRRSSSSPYYHNTYVYGTHGHGGGHYFDTNWLWTIILVIAIVGVIVAVVRRCRSIDSSETVTKTVVELDMTDADAQDLVEHPEKAAFYTAKYHHPPPGNTTTTTQVEVWRD